MTVMREFLPSAQFNPQNAVVLQNS